MLNIANLLEGLEKLIFEVLMWVVFVPKTLLKTLWDPDWVPQYVDEELSKKEGRFSNFISPLLLLILITVGLYGLVESFPLHLLDVNWQETAKVGETTTFYVVPEFRWKSRIYGRDDAIVEIWGVSNLEANTSYRIIRYNQSLSYLIDTDKLIDKYGKSVNTDVVLDVVTEEPTYSLEFTWEEPGRYFISVAYYSDQGELAGALHAINVFDDEGSISLPTAADRNNFQDIATVFENQERAFIIALAGLILPLWLALGTELIKRKPLTRAGLQRSLYNHSLYVAPLAMILLVAILAVQFYVPTVDWIKAEIHVSRTILVALAYLGYAILLWFLIAEVRFFKRELNQPIWVSVPMTAILLYIPYRVYEFIDIGYHIVVRNPQLFWFGLYIILHILILSGIVFIKILPDIWKWGAHKIFKRNPSHK